MPHFKKLIVPEMYYLDMDGTLFDLYSVPDWLKKLENFDVSPYRDAPPMWDMIALRAAMTEAKLNGARFSVISWLGKAANDEYKKETRKVKLEVLDRYFGLEFFNEIHIVQYGTPKHYVADMIGTLVDDNQHVRQAWAARGGPTINPLTQDLLTVFR